ncbi:MAG: hypothetical protein RLZZ127_1504 [Planctomycetota bacterium]|jgi:hypothetical protein
MRHQRPSQGPGNAVLIGWAAAIVAHVLVFVIAMA